MKNTKIDIDIYRKLAGIIDGQVDSSLKTRDFYSHDASMFELLPKAVIFPKNARDIEKIVKFVTEHKKSVPGLSITPRSAGTDMSGGAINDSIVMDMTKHFDKTLEVTPNSARVLPGRHYGILKKIH